MKALHYFIRIFRIRPSYIWGRFRRVRALYAAWKRMRQRLRGLGVPPLDGLAVSPITCTDAWSAVLQLQKSSLTQCIAVPPAMVEEIKQFALKAELEGIGVNRRFRYDDLKKGRLPDGTFVALGYCQNSTQCPAVCMIRDDPVLFSITANYLGYLPSFKDIHLYWSFAGEAGDHERRRRYQTIDYHFDVHDYNFCYVHIYLTDTDITSGAHVMVLGSHKSKPLRWLFGSAQQTDEAIEQHYGREKIVCLEGAAGTGFIEDTSCYHKALAPESSDRLLLQIRYH